MPADEKKAWQISNKNDAPHGESKNKFLFYTGGNKNHEKKLQHNKIHAIIVHVRKKYSHNDITRDKG
jgi:hypothetical protein